MSVWGAIAGGFVGTLVLTTVLRAATELGLTRIDLPFLLGIPDELGHTIRLHTPYADPKAEELFGEYAFADIRVFTATEPGLPLWAAGVEQALLKFYGYELDTTEGRYGTDSLVAHDQWVTLETPSAPTNEELQRNDAAFAFHRCLFTFNFFLRAVQAATHDIRIRPISSHDFRPVVIVGALVRGEGWRLLTEIFMHPEAHAEALPLDDGPITEAQLNAGLDAVATEKPYIATVLWRSRAQRRLNRQAMRQTRSSVSRSLLRACCSIRTGCF